MNRNLGKGIAALAAMFILIVESQNVLKGASAGVQVCLASVIPSLFPLFVLSNFATSNLLGQHFKILKPVMYLCNIPDGGEYILVLGMFGGYPVGAMAIAEAYKSNKLNRQAAYRLLGFCNNAGPAFIFGIIGPMLSSASACWVLWGIHMLSAVLTGMLLPGRIKHPAIKQESVTVTITQVLERSIHSISMVSGWVILFRVIGTMFEDRIGIYLPKLFNLSLVGMLELSNGCIALQQLDNEAEVFVMASGLLAAGGMCVWLQTRSVTKGLGSGLYMAGKLIQTAISVLLSLFLYPLITADRIRQACAKASILICLFTITTTLIIINCEKTVAFLRKILYSKNKHMIKESDHVVS